MPREIFEKIVFYRQEVDRLFNEVLGIAHADEHQTVQTPVDVVETDETFKIDVELPGVLADSIEVSASHHVLLIEGDKKETALAALHRGRYHQAERSYGRFQRILELPAAGDLGRVEGKVGRGVLTLTVPKVLDRRGQWRRVPVTADEEG